MITHEEAIKIMQVLESDDAYYNERIEEHKKMAEYIKQQEKITELLEVYKELSKYYKYKTQAYHDDEGVIQDIPLIEWNIMRLEKELGEMK